MSLTLRICSADSLLSCLRTANKTDPRNWSKSPATSLVLDSRGNSGKFRDDNNQTKIVDAVTDLWELTTNYSKMQCCEKPLVAYSKGVALAARGGQPERPRPQCIALFTAVCAERRTLGLFDRPPTTAVQPALIPRRGVYITAWWCDYVQVMSVWWQPTRLKMQGMKVGQYNGDGKYVRQARLG